MAVTGSITTRFVDEKGLDLGKTLIEKDYLISVYPNIVNQLDTPMLMGWGLGTSGQLGDNTATSKSSPVQTVAYGNNWKQISSGAYTCAGIKTDGTLWLWGANDQGQIGDNTVTGRSSPVQTVSFGSNWKQVIVRGGTATTFVAAIKNDGTLWCWGNNANGQLGDNTVTKRSSPVQTVAFGTNWKQVSAGNAGNTYHNTAAIKTDGTLWVWGDNVNGQLGDNTASNKRSSPVQTVAFGTSWMQVAVGNGHLAATKNDGSMWTWGGNGFGQLGDNTSLGKSSPVQTVTYDKNWKQISCGDNSAFTCATKTDGTLWCWGLNSSGQLGDNTATNKSSPVQTIAYGTNWKQVSAGGANCGAIKTDGTLWMWGLGTSGQLGDNTVTSKSSPVQTVIGGNNWKSVSADLVTFAIKDGDI